MSAHAVLAEALAQALMGHSPLGVAINGVFEAPPARAVRPYAVVEDAVLTDWSTKDMTGREGRLAVALFDAGDRPGRLRALTGDVVDAVNDMPRALAQGWRIVSLDFIRSRILREGEARLTAMVEFRVRMLQTN